MKFQIFENKKCVPVIVEKCAESGIKKIADRFAEDVKLACGVKPCIYNPLSHASSFCHAMSLRQYPAPKHERIYNLRDDWQWKLCHELCRKYDIICIEDLSIEGMKRLWGRKVSDLAFSEFVKKLEQVAFKYGCEIRKVDRYYASSKTCRHCGYVNKELSLRDRQWVCPECGAFLDRDLNAAMNIVRQGIASSGSPRKTKVVLRKGR